MLTYPLYALLAVETGQYGHLTNLQLHRRIGYKLRYTIGVDTFKTSINYFSNLSYISSSIGSDHFYASIHSPAASMSLDEP